MVAQIWKGLHYIHVASLYTDSVGDIRGHPFSLRLPARNREKIKTEKNQNHTAVFINCGYNGNISCSHSEGPEDIKPFPC